jgi:hypothetical protein
MRTAASVFISGTGIFEIADSFCLQKKEGDGDNEQSKKSKVRIHVVGGIESKHGKRAKRNWSRQFTTCWRRHRKSRQTSKRNFPRTRVC